MSQKEKTAGFQPEEEMSLKDLILNLQGWVRYFWAQKWIILAVGVLGGGLGLLYAWTQPVKYSAQLTFVVEENKSNALGAYLGLASQFGIEMGSGSGNGLFSGDNVLEFLKSRVMVESALLSPVSELGKTTTLAELYIRFNNMRDAWKNLPHLKNLGYPLNQPRNTFSLQQDSILNILRLTIVDKNLRIDKPDKKLDFIAVKCVSENETFSKFFTENLVKQATDFYIQTKTKRSKINVDRLQGTADSLELLLNRKTVQVAESLNLNVNPARQVANVGVEVQTRDKVILQTMYGEVRKNLEISKMSMMQEMPVIQVIDAPILPLEKVKLGKLKGIIIGGFLGGLLILLVLIAFRSYRRIMQS